MNKIIACPSEDELRNRIMRQLEWRDSSSTAALIWHGYLSALLEWGVLELRVFDQLTALLPRVGLKELHELFLDEPISPERELEIDEYLQRQSSIK